MITVHPLIYSQGSLDNLFKATKDALGFNPTSGIDNAHISIADPAALMSCLDYRNDPLGFLRSRIIASGLSEHFYLSFLIITQRDFELPLLTNLNIKTHVTETKKQLIILATTSIRNWLLLILNHMYGHSPYEQRVILNQVYDLLNQTAYRECFKPRSKKHLQDDTFILENKS